MAERPWTAVATDRVENKRVTFVFSSKYDTKDAADDFDSKFENYTLEALIPGDHKHVYIHSNKSKHTKRIPHDQMFSGF